MIPQNHACSIKNTCAGTLTCCAVRAHHGYRYGYAPDEMMQTAHEQISTCTCGSNYPMYNEQATTRVGWSESDAAVMFPNEISYEECATTGRDFTDDSTAEKCFASEPSLDTDSILEWGGQ